MKILIPVIGFGRAGGYRVLSRLANELIRLGHEVDFLCPNNDSPYYPTLAQIKRINKQGQLTSENSDNNNVKKKNAFAIQHILRKALSKIPKDSYHIILANHSLTTLPIKRAGLKDKTLYYVQAYEPDFYKLSGGLKNYILAYLSESSYTMELFTVVNAEIYLNYKRLKASRVLYPGVDFNYFYPKKADEETSSKNKIVLGTIGRKESYKGTRFIIEAFKILKRKFPELELHIAFGNPNDYPNIKDIYCFQPHGDKELGTFYRTLDCYICAGYTQLGAFHYPVVEAMSCGIPVITTHYFPASEENSWSISPQNITNIVTAFEQFRHDIKLREKKVKKALIDVKQFEWKKVGEKINQYIQELNNYLLSKR